MENKVTVYPIEQAKWGADKPTVIYFSNEQAQTDYLSTHDYCNTIPSAKLSPNYIRKYWIVVYDSVQEYIDALADSYPSMFEN